MNQILFPSINLKLNIPNIAFSIFGIEIYWYAIIITFAIVISILLMKRQNGKYKINFDDIIKLLIFVLPITIIGARIYYVLFKFDYYKNNLIEIFNIRNGGLAIYGGIISGIIVIIIYCKIKKIKILDLLDYIAPYLALGQSIGRWGNFFNIEAYGIETNSIFRMGIIENSKYIEVHPTFLYESISTLIIFIILNRISKNRKYSGQIICLYLLMYSFIRMIIEQIRSDSLIFQGFKISQIISLIIFIISILLIISSKIQNRKSNK